jgi:hypothetical protein
MTHRRNLNVDTIERTQNEKFHEWFRAHVSAIFCMLYMYHYIDFNMLLIADQETGERKWYQWYKK